MKERIESVLCNIFYYDIRETWEDERYLYVKLSSEIITSIALHELNEQDLPCIIDLDECRDGHIVLSFIK